MNMTMTTARPPDLVLESEVLRAARLVVEAEIDSLLWEFSKSAIDPSAHGHMAIAANLARRIGARPFGECAAERAEISDYYAAQLKQMALSEIQTDRAVGSHYGVAVSLVIEATAVRVQPIGIVYPLGVHPRRLPAAEIHRMGTDARNLKDANGKAFGLELYNAGQKPEGQITEVSYVFPKPGADTTPVPKVSFVTRVGDLYCGVGYYK